MFRNDLARSDLRCLYKGDLLFKPGRLHHAVLIIFHMADGARNHISHTVDHLRLESYRFSILIGKRYLHPFIRYEFRFRRHDRLSIAGLGELVNRTIPLIGVLNAR